ncbi:hypothetical protein PR048_009366 [Dryococelus australis]|uniref:Uncharacterized protein n=1 Tax=Dryococelus australis TaxID=614101 RepID=A0ABQ9HZP1_9NEOP|nr:hypothetical protein PR048_009366 [Dryococelus australis]
MIPDSKIAKKYNCLHKIFLIVMELAKSEEKTSVGAAISNNRDAELYPVVLAYCSNEILMTQILYYVLIPCAPLPSIVAPKGAEKHVKTEAPPFIKKNWYCWGQHLHKDCPVVNRAESEPTNAIKNTTNAEKTKGRETGKGKENGTSRDD